MALLVGSMVPASLLWTLMAFPRLAPVSTDGQLEEGLMSTTFKTAFMVLCVTACADDPLEPIGTGVPVHINHVGSLDTAVVATGDALLYKFHADDNFGTGNNLQVGFYSALRAIVQWDQAVLQGAVGTDSVESARMVLTVEQSGGWGHTGGTITAHRMTTAWTELGATWNCAIDSDPPNSQKDCSGATEWEMDDPPGPVPWVAPASDSVLLTDGFADTVSFDVTADVQNFLTGTNPNYGFILVADDASAGSARFTSREGLSADAPYLRLTLVQQDTARPAVPDSFVLYDTTIAVSPPYSSEVKYYRNILELRFDDTTSGARVNEVLTLYQAEIVGGFPSTQSYVVRVPDPGPTIADLDSLIASLRAEPGVDEVGGITFQDVIKGLGRYPIDGGLVTRQNWLGAVSDGTRAWRAIRAPLAWGCETGAYDPQPVSVGIVDWTFDPTHGDFGTLSFVEPSGVGVGQLRADTNVLIDHGTRVAGILAASGDNGLGIAGMLWESDLHLFALANATGDSSVGDASIYLQQQVIPAATAAGVRVLVSSVNIRGDVRNQWRIDRAMRSFVNANPGNLFVQAAGNDSAIIAVGTLLADQGFLGMIKAAAALVTGPEAGQVLIVAGTDNTGQFWQTGVQGRNSNFFTGGITEVAAPATNILSLSHQLVNGPNATSVDDGTSYAAPFVGGVAGMLLAMDPTLTATDIKRYIVDGAKEPRRNTTGQVQAPPPVPNAPETVYQLDAYGALNLLSRERQNVPICGVKVWAESASPIVAIGRDVVQTISVTGATSLGNLSVAQGGRLIAVASSGSQVFTMDHLGNQLETLSLRRRVYLERDTMDFLTSDSVVLTGPNGVPTFDPITNRIQPSDPTLWDTEVVEPSPFADWLAVRTHESNSLLCETTRWHLVRVATGDPPAILVHEMNGDPPGPGAGLQTEACNAGETSAGWSHDAQRVVITILRNSSGLATGLRNITIVNGVPTGIANETQIGGFWLFRPRFTADDSLLVINREDAADVCRLGYRLPTALANEVFDEFALGSDCNANGTQPPTIFNTRVAGTVSEPTTTGRPRRQPE